MNRRSFMRWLGLAPPLALVAAKTPLPPDYGFYPATRTLPPDLVRALHAISTPVSVTAWPDGTGFDIVGPVGPVGPSCDPIGLPSGDPDVLAQVDADIMAIEAPAG